MCLFVFAISVSTIALIGGGGRASSFPTAYVIWCIVYCMFSVSFRAHAHNTSQTQTQTLPR